MIHCKMMLNTDNLVLNMNSIWYRGLVMIHSDITQDDPQH